MLVLINSHTEARLRTALMEMQSSGELCDFTIQSGGHIVRAHKCVLAATLQYFRTSFRFSESDTNETSLDLSHLNCDVNAIERVVQCLYSKQIEVNLENLASVLEIADYLMHNDLMQALEGFMEQTLDITTAPMYFQLCLQYSFNKNHLFTHVCRLLSSRWHDYLINHPFSLDWSLDSMEVMLTYGLFDHCTPIQMTNFVFKKLERMLWKTDKCDKDELDSSSSATLNFLERYFSHLDKSTLQKWRIRIHQCLDSWPVSNADQLSGVESIQAGLTKISSSMMGAPDSQFLSFDHYSGIHKRPSVREPCTDNTHSHSGDSLCHTDPCPSKNKKFKFHSVCKVDDIDVSITSKTSATDSSDSDVFKNHSYKNSTIPTTNIDSNNVHHEITERTEHITDSKDDETECKIRIKNSPSSISSSPLIGNGSSANAFENNNSTTALQSDSNGVSNRNSISSATSFLPKWCDSLVVLSPSPEMVSQLMEVEAGKAKPLLRSPQLSVHFYDSYFRVWKTAGIVEFPVHGYMMEKHLWRTAFVGKSLFLFSLTKRKGFEFNIEEKQWKELSCDNIFKPHSATCGESEENRGDDHDDSSDSISFPVKSIIPISMEDELVVLSMSREPREDRSFWTQQHIYQWDLKTRSFRHVTCVRDARMDLPATKWTVEGNDLVTVKASTMMFGDLQMFNVQHVHIYNAKTRRLETHHIDCHMKSGLKIFLQGKKLYLLNNFAEYRVYDLITRNLSDWTKLSNLSSNLYCGDPDLEISYPAGIRLSCHAGSSRWTLNSNFNVLSASLSEHHVTEEGEFAQHCHPNPPFQYMMTMCSARLDSTLLASLDQAVFDLPCVYNQ